MQLENRVQFCPVFVLGLTCPAVCFRSEAKYPWLGYHGNVRLFYVTVCNPTNNATTASMGRVAEKKSPVDFLIIHGYTNYNSSASLT